MSYFRIFIEKMFFSPTWYHHPVIVCVLPFSFLYGFIMFVRRQISSRKMYDIPIVSVGNLIVGGSGKTPFVIALAYKYQDITIISRGYGRKSKGLIEVSRKGEILTNTQQGGDEAMLMALSLPNASVIVSEDREKAILLAQKQGAKIIILDDAFSRVEIEKFEILLEPYKINNYFAFPAGPFREFFSTRVFADIVAKERRDFYREVEVIHQTEKMVLVTAISNPHRLDEYLPANVVAKVYYDDHAYFDESTLQKLLMHYDATSILCTSKDRVKMQDFKLDISEMKLKLKIKKEIKTQVDAYIQGYKNA